jgi:hypothetical protein
MARPKKRRGFRQIIVNEIEYRWRLAAATPHSSLRVNLAETKGQTLFVQLFDFIRYTGLWTEQLLSATTNERVIITNKFVKQVILFALENGWKPEISASDFHIAYLNSEFQIIQNPNQREH